MVNLGTRARASIAAAMLLAATVVGAGAQSDQANVDIVVTSDGVLSVVIVEAQAFPNLEYGFSAQTIEGVLRVAVEDLRGTAAGWTFNIRGTNFSGSAGGPGDSFPIGGLSLDGREVNHVAGNPNVSGISTFDIAAVSTGGQQALTADPGFGNGRYLARFLGDLTIPGDTLVDTYTTTITIEVPVAP